MAAGRLPLLQDRRRASSRRRTSTRTSGRSPSWTSTPPRAAMRSSSRARTPPTCSRSRPRTSRAVARAGQRLAGRAKERLGADGVNLLNSCGARRLADRLPLPRARDPALRRRPAAAAVDARPGRPRRDRGGRGGAAHDAPAAPRARRPARRRHASTRRRSTSSTERWATALEAAIAELEREPPRGLLLRAEGRVVSGGVDVNLFQDRVGRRRRGERLLATCCRSCRARRGAAVPDGLRRPRAVPDLGLRARARLRPAAGRRGGALRARRARASGSRPRWAGRSGSPSAPGPARARELVYTGDALRRGDARALERRQPRAARRGLRRRRARLRARPRRRARRARTRRPRRSSAPTCEGGVGGGRPRHRRAPRAPCSRPRTCAAPCASFLAEGPGKATFEGR